MKFRKPPMRIWVGIMIIFTTALNYCFRSHFQISLIAMLDKTGRGKKNETKDATTATPLPDYGPRYKWNSHEEGLLIAGYFYGYMVGSLLGGPLVEFIGPWHTIFWTSIISALLSCVSVWVTMEAWWPLFICRLGVGFMGGFQYPALQCLIARWSPPDEKGRFVACLMGNTLGTVLTNAIAGVVVEYMGWNWSFYMTVVVTGLFCLLWFFLVADYPDKQWFIKQEEVTYITEAQGTTISQRKVTPPFLKMLTSIPFIISMIFQFGNLFGLFLILTQVPKFIDNVLQINIKTIGWLSALPHLSRLVFGFAFGALADFILHRQLMPKKILRKTFTIFSHILPGLTLFYYMFITNVSTTTKVIVILLLVVMMAFNGAAVTTSIMQPQDLAPNFAATQVGFMNFFGSMPGFVIPSMVGAITKEKSEMPEWRIIFGICGSVIIFCGILFIIFGSTDLQPWNEKKSEEETNT